MVDRSFCPRCQRIVYNDIKETRCPVCYSVLDVVDVPEDEKITAPKGDEEVA
jgi:hypothetical protein